MQRFHFHNHSNVPLSLSRFYWWCLKSTGLIWDVQISFTTFLVQHFHVHNSNGGNLLKNLLVLRDIWITIIFIFWTFLMQHFYINNCVCATLSCSQFYWLCNLFDKFSAWFVTCGSLFTITAAGLIGGGLLAKVEAILEKLPDIISYNKNWDVDTW